VNLTGIGAPGLKVVSSETIKRQCYVMHGGMMPFIIVPFFTDV